MASRTYVQKEKEIQTSQPFLEELKRLHRSEKLVISLKFPIFPNLVVVATKLANDTSILFPP